MVAVSWVGFFVFCLVVHELSAEEDKVTNHPECPHSFNCGKLGNLSFPFTNPAIPLCGFFSVSDCNGTVQTIQLDIGKRVYEVERISFSGDILINDTSLRNNLKYRSCQYFHDSPFLCPAPYLSFHFEHNITVFKCNRRFSLPFPSHKNFLPLNCSAHDYDLYYSSSHQHNDSSTLIPPPSHCSTIQLPANPAAPKGGDFYSLLSPTFRFHVQIDPRCLECYNRGEFCHKDTPRSFSCATYKLNYPHPYKLNHPPPYKRNYPPIARDKDRLLKKKLAIGLGIGLPSLLVICLLSLYMIWRRNRNKQKYSSSDYNIRNNSSDPSSSADLEGGSVCFGLPIFSYSELEEATNHFKESNEIGDGGFGAVYYGKLKDGREVAVKRLYEHNYRRLEQFINEIEILTRLRHKNLVSLYGCTSRRSRELLLVYEFIPNGTLAYHLHGEGSKTGSMTWPIRMSIALETASALAYLHASDTIHRDVKTDNILLDNNFCVKVADFGLSRLFPLDVTHVSTAPQGTPGYVDPEYHQCYQLTDKSDVYSFGVVLIELISSMPAVDISRHRHDINLANLALNRIQRRAFNELVDPSLGFDSDENIRTQIMLVAELAFRCLQQDKEMRPDMVEVFENLEIIEKSGKFQEMEGTEGAESAEAAGDDDDLGGLKSVKPPPSPDCCDEVGLLKNMQPLPSPEYDEVRLMLKSNMRSPSSPISVTERWISNTTTPNPSS